MIYIINHRILNHWCWKGPVEIIKSNPSARSRFSQSRLLRTLSSQGLNVSKDGDSTTSLGNLFWCLPCSHWKRLFSSCLNRFPVFQFVSISSCPFTGYHCVESGSVFFELSCHMFIYIDDSLWDFFSWTRLSLDTSVPITWKKVCCSWSECKFHVSKPADILIQQLRRSPKIVCIIIS